MKTSKNGLAILGAKDGQFPKTAISLLEIMQEFKAHKICEFICSIDLCLEKIPKNEALSQQKSQTIMTILGIEAENGLLKNSGWFQMLHEMGWDDARRRLSELSLILMEKSAHSESISRCLSELKWAIFRELSYRKFAAIDTQKSIFLGQKNLFGESVANAFPSSKDEIVSAGNCLALDLNTAAIFHLMRVAELGMRALARHLKVKCKKNTIDSGGWSEIISGIEAATASRWQKIPKAKVARRKAVAFLKLCEVSADELNVFKEVWRNNVMHAGFANNEQEAHGVYIRVRDFMQRLSKEVSEK